MQVVPAVAFRLGVVAVFVPAGADGTTVFKFAPGALLGAKGAAGVTGTTQVVRQFAACELHVIMQLVTVEDWARRIFSPASAACAKTTANAVAARIDAKLRMAPPRLESLEEIGARHHSGRAM
jgi:hypothetical protein